MKKVIIAVPSYGFDPTESAVPWSRLRQEGHQLAFATPSAKPAAADRRMVTGADLPLLFKASLMAQKGAVRSYEQMQTSEEFLSPISYEDIDVKRFDALLLPGGHDKGMREYLESPVLQRRVVDFFKADKPVAAICHGTLLVARSLENGQSVLFGRKTTGLTRKQEMIAWHLTRSKLGDYYRTYETPMADELISYLRSPQDYDPGPGLPIPFTRDSERNLRPGFVVKDGNYLSARWPGDAHRFADEFAKMLS